MVAMSTRGAISSARPFTVFYRELQVLNEQQIAIVLAGCLGIYTQVRM